ncbi:uncharacterized protein [Aegilops tauschii subsp. strangulata]|uniref:uncharacterized protein isoform X3 n=1 Tax=Aegilops tauschii subsp. strangulata TaxID=200361 RepID=UPI001ABD1552|nr:uncharacterized protein LOC120974127 isoform X3 [Aegilops tauschii subsp. strangulata]XP_040256531.1 uncharacterized protein LOC120974127 isoform X3 [Aegilops tauschii subsp. strangulata]
MENEVAGARREERSSRRAHGDRAATTVASRDDRAKLEDHGYYCEVLKVMSLLECFPLETLYFQEYFNALHPRTMQAIYQKAEADFGEEYLPGVVCAAMTRRGRSDDLSGQRGEDARAAATRLGRRRLGLLLATGMSNWTTGRSLVEGPAGGGRRRRGLLLATGTSSWTTGRSLAEAPAGGGRRRRRRMGLLLVWTSSWRRGGACCWPGCAALEEDNEVLSFVFTWSEISPSDNYFGTEGVVGCHLFMQVFILDSLELGVLNKPQGVTPRIGLYDYE